MGNTLNSIGLDQAAGAALAAKLNELLSEYSVFYQNSRGYHWNIKGKEFFELHVKFEELYNDLFLKIDEVAERILTLGHTPQHQFSDYLQEGEIQESGLVTDGIQAVKEILSAFQVLLVKQRAILQSAGEIDDEGTTALMSDYIREQEKLVWMYSAYIDEV